jgi:hypothetical protein
MKAGWHTLVAQIRLANISSILDLNLHTGKRPQISLCRVCCVPYLYVCIGSTFLSLALVTNPLARMVREDLKGPVPHTAAEFASAFLASGASVANRIDIDAYLREFVDHPDRAHAYRQSAMEEHATTQPKGSPYTISIPMQARAVMLRRLQILRGHISLLLISLMYVLSSD